MIKESELDDDQIKVLIETLDKSCIVAGCAGSGKSVLALIKAQRIQKEYGTNYKVIVFTKALCKYMNSGKKELGLQMISTTTKNGSTNVKDEVGTWCIAEMRMEIKFHICHQPIILLWTKFRILAVMKLMNF